MSSPINFQLRLAEFRRPVLCAGNADSLYCLFQSETLGKDQLSCFCSTFECPCRQIHSHTLSENHQMEACDNVRLPHPQAQPEMSVRSNICRSCQRASAALRSIVDQTKHGRYGYYLLPHRRTYIKNTKDMPFTMSNY